MEGVYLRRRACVVCSEPIVERGRIDRMYCSGGCRTLAWKARKLRRKSGVADRPALIPARALPVCISDYMQPGAFTQLAQRLDSERILAQRELTAAQLRIRELEQERGQQRAGQTSAEQIAELKHALNAAQKQSATLEQLLQAAQQETTNAKKAAAAAEQRAQAAEQGAKTAGQWVAEKQQFKSQIEAIKKDLTTAQQQKAELQTKLRVNQSEQIAVEERAKTADQHAAQLQTKLAVREQTIEADRKLISDLRSQLSTLEQARSEAERRAVEAESRSQVAAQSLASMHADIALKTFVAAMCKNGGERAADLHTFFQANQDLLRTVARTSRVLAQRMASQGETDTKAIASRALELTRRAVVANVPKTLAEATRILFQENHTLLSKLAETIATAVIRNAAPKPSGVPTCSQPMI